MPFTVLCNACITPSSYHVERSRVLYGIVLYEISIELRYLVKTYSQTFYKPNTRFTEVKTSLTEVIKASYTICGVQNDLSNVTQHPFTLYESQNGLFKFIHATYMPCKCQNGLSDLCFYVI